MGSGRLETRLLEHLPVFVERVGVPFGCGRQHDEAEAGGLRWSHSIGVRHKFDNGDLSTRAQSRMCFFQEGNAIGTIEMVQEVWNENDVVVSSQLHLESASR